MTNSSQTVIDGDGRTFLVLRALVSHSAHQVDPAGNDLSWCAEVCDAASPLAGLYAFGDSPRAAGEALAIAAWAAMNAGELVPFDVTPDGLAGVRVDAMTCAAYEADWLTAAAANDAA